MQVIKEAVEQPRRCIIRTDTYGHTLQLFYDLFGEAQKDFPNLKQEEVEIVHYAGDRYKRTFGIEFVPEEGVEIPQTYMRIKQTELTL